MVRSKAARRSRWLLVAMVVVFLSLALPGVAHAALEGTGPGRITVTCGTGDSYETWLQVRGSGSYAWSVSSDQAWCAVSPASGDQAMTTVTVTVSVAGLAAGAHDATIRVTSGATTLLVPVRLHVVTAPNVARYSGTDRYQTSADISEKTFRSAGTVVVATGEQFADALAASPLAGCYDAPVLLTRRYSLPPDIVTEIRRLGATKAIIVGSARAVSDDVSRQLQGLGLSVERGALGYSFAGADRYETAARIALAVEKHEGLFRTMPYHDYAFLCRGDDFADALSAAPMAYHMRMPILLVRPASCPGVSKAAMDVIAPQAIQVVGGPAAISDGTAGSLGRYWVRHGGRDRYETASLLTNCAIGAGCAGFGYIGIATGENFPDAVSGGAACGANGGIMLLTRQRMVPTYTYDMLVANKARINGVRLFGGAPAIGVNVENTIKDAVH